MGGAQSLGTTAPAGVAASTTALAAASHVVREDLLWRPATADTSPAVAFVHWPPDDMGPASVTEEVERQRQRQRMLDGIVHHHAANGTEAKLQALARAVADTQRIDGMRLTPSEALHVGRGVLRALHQREAAGRALGVDAAQKLLSHMHTWRDWATLLDSCADEHTLVDTWGDWAALGHRQPLWAQAVPLPHDRSRADASTVFRHTKDVMLGAAKRHARRAVRHEPVSFLEFRTKVDVLLRTHVLDAQDAVQAEHVADALVRDAVALVRDAVALTKSTSLRGASSPYHAFGQALVAGKDGGGDVVAAATCAAGVPLNAFAIDASAGAVALQWVSKLLAAAATLGFGARVLQHSLQAVQHAIEQRDTELHRAEATLRARFLAMGTHTWDPTMVAQCYREHGMHKGPATEYKSQWRQTRDGCIDMVWPGVATLDLQTRVKTYDSVRLGLKDAARLGGGIPAGADPPKHSFAEWLPAGCIPLGHPRAVERYPESLTDDLARLCSRVQQLVLGVDDFCIAENGTVYCVHATGPGAGQPPPCLQPPWLYSHADGPMAFAELVQQILRAVLGLVQLTERIEERRSLPLFVHPLGALQMPNPVVRPTLLEHAGFQAGAVVLDAVLGVSSHAPNFNFFLHRKRCVHLLQAAVRAMNHALQPMQRLHPALDAVPLHTLRISSAGVGPFGGDDTHAAARGTGGDDRVNLLPSELLGKVVPRVPLGTVTGRLLLTMRVQHDRWVTNTVPDLMFSLLQLVVSERPKWAFKRLFLTETDTVYGLEFDAKGAWKEEVSLTRAESGPWLATQGSTRLVVTVAYKGHQHVLVVLVHRGLCVHFDPHGRLAKRQHAQEIQEWFQTHVAGAWHTAQPLHFQAVHAWCTLLGPQQQQHEQTKRVQEQVRSAKAQETTLVHSVQGYVAGSCMVWSLWFAMMVVTRPEWGFMTILDRLHEELQRRAWTYTQFVERFLEDVVAVAQPYITLDKSGGSPRLCIAYRTFEHVTLCPSPDMSALDRARFNLVHLALMGNGLAPV